MLIRRFSATDREKNSMDYIQVISLVGFRPMYGWGSTVEDEDFEVLFEGKIQTLKLGRLQEPAMITLGRDHPSPNGSLSTLSIAIKGLAP